jgi:alpha-L-rhamnosidase
MKTRQLPGRRKSLRKSKIGGLAVCGFFGLASLAQGETLRPVELRADGRENPLAVSASPRLSWRVESEDRGQTQSAWRILVAADAETLAEHRGEVWDSGKTAAGRSPFVGYDGPRLSAGERYHWKVRSWDADDEPSAWSDPAVMEIAPQAPKDWHGAVWIDDGRANPGRDQDFYRPDPAPLMRREFTLDKPVVRARLHVAGLGLGLPSLNGERLADHVFDPPWTPFAERILFRTHDVTARLVEGDNCLGLTLGNGWYNPLPLRMWGHRNIRGSLTTGRPRGIACLVAEHPDGSQTVVTSGPDWSTTGGPTLKNSIFLGEVRDARKALPGWDRAGFDDVAWRPVRATDDPLEPLRPLEMPPVRAAEPIPAVDVTTPSPGVHIVDFGRNFTGVPEIELQAPEGTRITFRFGELLHEDGSLNPLTSVAGQIKGTRAGPDGGEVPIGGPGSPEVAWQRDVYIARGGGPERFRPDFTFHGFRFMEITGLPEAPEPDAFRGIPFSSALPDAGSFASSNERLNRIQQMCRRTFLANVMTVQSDCPHRERFAYGGDIVASSEAFLMNFDMAGFYAKTVRDWHDAARPDGRFTDTAPFVGIDYCGVGWAMVHPLLLEQLHTHYGTRGLVEEQLPAAMRWLEGEASRREDGLVMKGLGDHEALKRIAGPVLTTPMFIETARRVARLAKLVGRDADAARFEAMAAESASAWADAFLNVETGEVGGGSQSELVMALGFGAAPDAARPEIFERLVAELTAPDDGPRLTTGIFGTRILPEFLSRRGRGDLAYALADRNTFPSWGWMLENDATTLWEHWAFSDGTFSHSHPMFGSISAWFFRWLGGIQPADDAVGFDRIRIRPQVVGDLEWVESSHRSIRGLIESNWSVGEQGVDYEIVIPPDTTAVIELPAAADDTVTESGQPLGRADGLTVLSGESTPSVRRLRAGSGHYRFEVRRAR